jgi:hypothetical protein
MPLVILDFNRKSSDRVDSLFQFFVLQPAHFPNFFLKLSVDHFS